MWLCVRSVCEGSVGEGVHEECVCEIVCEGCV